MSDWILIDQDHVIFFPSFGTALVAVKPGQLKASGGVTLNGKKVCIKGDEKSVEVPGCSYLTPTFVLPGSGTLYIESLAPDQIAVHTNSNGTLVMLKGSLFNAKFQVTAPAIQPGLPPVPDPTTIYSGGQGQFVTTNSKFTGI